MKSFTIKAVIISIIGILAHYVVDELISIYPDKADGFHFMAGVISGVITWNILGYERK